MNKSDFTKIINNNIQSYLSQLKDNFNKYPEYLELVNSIYFPDHNIMDWFSGLSLESFYGSRYSGPISSNRFCTLEELDQIRFEFISAKDDNYFFPNIKTNTGGELPDKYRKAYYIIQDDFIQRIDRTFLNFLKDYKKKFRTPFVFSKIISDKITFHFNTKRRDFNFFWPSDYYFPDFYIEVNGESLRISNDTDLSTFLFLPSRSFLFFYVNSHNFYANDLGQIFKVERKNDEPISVYSESDGCYIVTNSPSNKIRYNKFIYLVIYLQAHYLRVFETWLSSLPELRS